MYRQLIKRGLDFLSALTGLVILLPVLLIVAVLLFFANSGRPFFTQIRPGRNSRLFKIIKFKTMNDRKDADGHLLPDSERLTKVGKIVRKTSLDEIPQLLNVLKGDMSLVGPRPLLVEYLPLYSKEQARRHKVRPGITGWAQINGRNAISWEQKFNLDVWYVDHVAFSLDIKIGWKTITKVFRSEGVNASADTTMEKFTGNQRK